MSERRAQKVLSCSSCRQRKIKCDKTLPICTLCARAGIECLYPSRKPTRRAPRTRQSELLDRISRLESIVGKADPARLEELDRAFPSHPPRSKTRNSINVDDGATVVSKEGSSSRSETAQTTTADTAARYLGTEFWSNLCEEVVGIKQALDEPSDEEEFSDDAYEDSNESQEAYPQINYPSGHLFGNPSYHDKEKPSHPPRDMMLRLWAVYLRNVDPLIKILHRPTLTEDIQMFANSSSRPLSAPEHARLFSIYFAAVTTLSDEECLKQLGRPKRDLAANFRLNTERALAAADYLSQPTLVTLQSLAIYVVSLWCFLEPLLAQDRHDTKLSACRPWYAVTH